MEILGAKMQKGTWAHRCNHGVKIDLRLIPHWCRNSRKKFDYRSRDFGSRDRWLSKERMGCRWGWGQGMGMGQGQWWVMVGVPMWHTDGGGNVVVGVVSTESMYRDRVHQRSWHWYGVMVHWMHHWGNDGDAVIVVSDMPLCGHCPKWLSGWGVHAVQALVRVWAWQ